MQKLGSKALPRGEGWYKVYHCKSRKCVGLIWRIAKRSNYVPYIQKIGGLSSPLPYALYVKKLDCTDISSQELNSLIQRMEESNRPLGSRVLLKVRCKIQN